LSFASRTPRTPDFMIPRSSYAPPPRQPGKLIKKSRRGGYF
jgi:hypothetical protein